MSTNTKPCNPNIFYCSLPRAGAGNSNLDNHHNIGQVPSIPISFPQSLTDSTPLVHSTMWPLGSSNTMSIPACYARARNRNPGSSINNISFIIYTACLISVHHLAVPRVTPPGFTYLPTSTCSKLYNVC